MNCVAKFSMRYGLLATVGVAAMSAVLSGEAEAQILGTAESFGILAGSTVTNTGPSVLQGNVGVFPGGAVIGFPPGIVLPPGVIHAGDATANLAQNSLTTAYTTLQALPFQVSLTGQDLGGLVLGPAVYNFANSAQLTGLLTLNGFGNTAAQFVFQIGSALTTASNSAVLLINGANGNNVYWAVGSSATLGTNTVFAGNILAQTSIALNTGAIIVCGRALARTGAVTLDTNTLTLCVPGTAGSGGTDTDTETLGGGGVSGATQAAFGASNLFGSTLLAQAAIWREGAPDRTGVSPQNSPMKLGVLSGGEQPVSGTAYQPRTWRLWTSGLASAASLRSDMPSGSAELTTRSAGVAVGLDAQIDRDTLFGIAGGYTNSHFSIDRMLTGGTLEGGHFGIYGVKRFGRLYLAASGEYAHHTNTTDRFIDWVIDERARGQFSSDVFTFRSEMGWRHSAAGYNVTPFAGVALSHYASAGYTEQSQGVLGAPGILGLKFDPTTARSEVSTLGIQFDTRVTSHSGHTFTPFARVAWGHEFSSDRGMSSSLALSPAAVFSTRGVVPARDFAKVNAGLRVDLTQNVGLFTYIDAEFSERSHSYTGTGGFRISW